MFPCVSSSNLRPHDVLAIRFRRCSLPDERWLAPVAPHICALALDGTIPQQQRETPLERRRTRGLPHDVSSTPFLGKTASIITVKQRQHRQTNASISKLQPYGTAALSIDRISARQWKQVLKKLE